MTDNIEDLKRRLAVAEAANSKQRRNELRFELLGGLFIIGCIIAGILQSILGH